MVALPSARLSIRLDTSHEGLSARGLRHAASAGRCEPRLALAGLRRRRSRTSGDNEAILSRMTLFLVLALLLSCQGCFVAPLRVANTLDVTIVDAQNSTPIPDATAVYFVCDIHDFQCRHATLVRAASNAHGNLKIRGRREWGVWFPAPGGLPVPNHFIAIWAPGYSAFVFGQYRDTVDSIRRHVPRQDLLEALDSIPSDQSSSDPSLNPKEQLHGGKIRLRKEPT